MCLKMLFIPVLLPAVADWEAGCGGVSGSYLLFLLEIPARWGGCSSPTLFLGRR